MPGVRSLSTVAVRRLHPDARLPLYATQGDAGADLTSVAQVTLAPGERALVPTGIAIALPDGYAGFVHPRSGLAARSGLTIVNAPGTVDAGYRGEIKVCLLNTDRRTPIKLKRGDLISLDVGVTLDFGDLRRICLLRHTVGDAADSITHIIRRPFDIAIQRKFQRDAGTTVTTLRLNGLDTLDTGQRIFQHLGHAGLDNASGCARIADIDRHDRWIDVRQFAQRQPRERDQP